MTAAAREQFELDLQRDAEEQTPPELGTFEHHLAWALTAVREALGTETPTTKRRPKRRPLFVDAAELLARTSAQMSWLVSQLMTRGGIATIGGEPKSTKTWLAAELAVAVATGTPAFGQFTTTMGVAAYFFAEDGEQQVRNRVRALLDGRSKQVDPSGRLYLCPRGQFLDITRDDDLAWIVASGCHLNKFLDLLILDPLRDISSANEDRSDEMSDVMRRLRIVGSLLECTVAIVHHSHKSSADTAKRRPGQKLRGSGAIHGATDSGIYIGAYSSEGSTCFHSDVTSEVKGARSAGRFSLELRIEDDVNGEAIQAEWTVNRDGGGENKTNARDAADDEAVLEHVRALHAAGEPPLGKTNLRNVMVARGMPDHRTRAAIDGLLGAGKLVTRDSGRLRDRLFIDARSASGNSGQLGENPAVPFAPGGAGKGKGL